MTAVVVLASLTLVGGSAAAAHAGSVPTGYDVSYPQCNQTLPAGQAFGVVAVNEGLGNTTNPCLAAEIAWAQASTGQTSQKNCSLAPRTGGGTVTVVQWTTKPVNRDLACRPPPPKLAGAR